MAKERLVIVCCTCGNVRPVDIHRIDMASVQRLLKNQKTFLQYCPKCTHVQPQKVERKEIEENDQHRLSCEGLPGCGRSNGICPPKCFLP